MGTSRRTGGGFLSDTIAYYDRNADRFFNDTVAVDMEPLYKPFLEQVPARGRILDAGCGSGRDTQWFLQSGYRVEAFDASREMCALASNLTGTIVKQQRFEDIQYCSEFDGVWACASVLHVPKREVPTVLAKLAAVLKIGGVMFISFKLRDEEWSDGERNFSGYTPESFRRLLQSQSALSEIQMWKTSDRRPNRAEMWLNVLLRREQ